MHKICSFEPVRVQQLPREDHGRSLREKEEFIGCHKGSLDPVQRIDDNPWREVYRNATRQGEVRYLLAFLGRSITIHGLITGFGGSQFSSSRFACAASKFTICTRSGNATQSWSVSISSSVQLGTFRFQLLPFVPRSR